jgi:AcrR family transcriptional regulator
VEAALKVIDEYGLEDFSLATVASRLKVQAPSLYYHFHDKSEILGEVARQLFADAEPDIPRLGNDWESWVINTSLAVRRSMLRHPKAVPLLLSNPPRDTVLKAYERALRYLERCNLPKEERLLIIAGLDAIQWGSILFEAAAVSSGVRSFALFDSESFQSRSKTDRAHQMDDEAVFVAVARSFLHGLRAGAWRAKRSRRTTKQKRAALPSSKKKQRVRRGREAGSALPSRFYVSS